MKNNIEEYLKKIDEVILSHLGGNHISGTIAEASRYSIKSGGKRFRPYLLFAALDAFSTPLDKGLKTASAIEMIHTYSLIHDDLPAMDDDDLRRGNPTNHKVFGEAAAILAGDNLLTESFHLIVNDEKLSAGTRLELVRIIADSAGQNGMIGGQMLDIEAENEDITFEELETIHKYKTGRLISAPVHAAVTIAEADDETASHLLRFSEYLGITFQIRDDILDVTGDVKVTGKNTGSDARKDKVTYVSAFGLEGAKERMEQKVSLAETELDAVKRTIDITELKNVLNKFAIREN
ncbi:polyprenyl synthetase family protein [Salinicoccus halitifaciens]|uniref:Geranylgeranyl diphosphate synthase type II n=1 Tax=Salinicoccus halitifaciens TaxID=1073415 RepID=A0ABV2E6I8_9STAP|nr:farnesyl diphosphate synthase [Salinicoccus halitifaciens]MCD2136915.1 polyprenyl synthetase family protein [Salinicoccus halitifaciens]